MVMATFHNSLLGRAAALRSRRYPAFAGLCGCAPVAPAGQALFDSSRGNNANETLLRELRDRGFVRLVRPPLRIIMAVMLATSLYEGEIGGHKFQAWGQVFSM
jgi:hypothetical protein